MSYNRINQAVNESDWDLVIELATKQKDEKVRLAKIAADQAAARIDPAKVEVIITGRNGYKLTYGVEIGSNQPVEKLDVRLDRNFDENFDWFASQRLTLPPVTTRMTLDLQVRS